MNPEKTVISLVIENRYHEFHHGLHLAKEARTMSDVVAVASALEKTADRLIVGANPFAAGLALAFCGRVNWVEVAQAVVAEVQKVDK